MSVRDIASPAPATLAGNVLARSALQFAAILMLSLVAGSTFGIWRGLGEASFTAATFIEVHQQLVRGLNVLLPAMGAVSAVLLLALAWLARRNRRALRFYLVAFVLSVAAGLMTRIFNQPINARVMTWTVQTLPANWMDIRDSWWTWHIIRTFVSIGATANLVLAVMADRTAPAGD